MHHYRIPWRVILLVAAGLLLAASATFAQTGGGFDLTWSTIDGGGGASTGGSFSLAGTSGQPDAGALLSGGSYTLVGGFWSETWVPRNWVWLPLVLR